MIICTQLGYSTVWSLIDHVQSSAIKIPLVLDYWSTNGRRWLFFMISMSYGLITSCTYGILWYYSLRYLYAANMIPPTLKWTTSTKTSQNRIQVNIFRARNIYWTKIKKAAALKRKGKQIRTHWHSRKSFASRFRHS